VIVLNNPPILELTMPKPNLTKVVFNQNTLHTDPTNQTTATLTVANVAVGDTVLVVGTDSGYAWVGSITTQVNAKTWICNDIQVARVGGPQVSPEDVSTTVTNDLGPSSPVTTKQVDEVP
jgi:hypothetical protein